MSILYDIIGMFGAIFLGISIVTVFFINPVCYLLSGDSSPTKPPVPRPRRDIPTRKPSSPPKPVTCDYDPEHELSHPFSD